MSLTKTLVPKSQFEEQINAPSKQDGIHEHETRELSKILLITQEHDTSEENLTPVQPKWKKKHARDASNELHHIQQSLNPNFKQTFLKVSKVTRFIATMHGPNLNFDIDVSIKDIIYCKQEIRHYKASMLVMKIYMRSKLRL